ncbi:MAG: anti-sigma regulatory factor [Leptolyngbyaceae cyanobacterium bins.59]|nr:anti-sigma regulatory factor [Leptolyngbyaceae cyanobacterium bins.59]
MTSIEPNDSQILQKIHLRVKSVPTASGEVLAWFERLNQSPVLDKTVWWQCQTALKEGFDNVVEYAHKNLPTETPIDLEAIRFQRRIEIRIWDYGSPFDLARKLQEMPELEENDADHGRGLKIMQRIADTLAYLRTEDNRNCLLIIKQY